jgi:hypothetical protein
MYGHKFCQISVMHDRFSPKPPEQGIITDTVINLFYSYLWCSFICYRYLSVCVVHGAIQAREADAPQVQVVAQNIQHTGHLNIWNSYKTY